MKNYPLIQLKKDVKYYAGQVKYWQNVIDKKLYLVKKITFNIKNEKQAKSILNKYQNIALQYQNAYKHLLKLKLCQNTQNPTSTI